MYFNVWDTPSYGTAPSWVNDLPWTYPYTLPHTNVHYGPIHTPYLTQMYIMDLSIHPTSHKCTLWTYPYALPHTNVHCMTKFMTMQV